MLYTEIIKVMKDCGCTPDCNWCPYFDPKNEYSERCYERRNKDFDNLIERKLAEIEMLKKENEILSINADTAFQDGLNEAQDLYKKQVESEIKSEAVKEFAARLKCGVPQETGVIRCSDIDNLVKEMVGEDELKQKH